MSLPMQVDVYAVARRNGESLERQRTLELLVEMAQSTDGAASEALWSAVSAIRSLPFSE